MIFNKKPEMIIFDVGGTLFDDGKCDFAAGFEKLRLMAINPEVTDSNELARYWEEYCSALSGSNLEIPLQSVIRYATMKTGLKIDLSMAQQEEIFDRYNSNRKVIDGVKELLLTADKLGIRTAVISNNMMSGESLEISLGYWIPESKFEFCVSSADLLFKKPEKYLFESAMSFAQVEPCNCVYCGDGLIPDVKGSLDAGMNAVLIDSKSDAQFEIRIFEDKDYIAVNSWRHFEKYLNEISLK